MGSGRETEAGKNKKRTNKTLGGKIMALQNEKREKEHPQPNQGMHRLVSERLHWPCEACRAILGFLSKDKTEVRIKYKDCCNTLCPQ